MEIVEKAETETLNLWEWQQITYFIRQAREQELKFN